MARFVVVWYLKLDLPLRPIVACFPHNVAAVPPTVYGVRFVSIWLCWLSAPEYSGRSHCRQCQTTNAGGDSVVASRNARIQSLITPIVIIMIYKHTILLRLLSCARSLPRAGSCLGMVVDRVKPLGTFFGHPTVPMCAHEIESQLCSPEISIPSF